MRAIDMYRGKGASASMGGSPAQQASRPIGVFDSGVGGLTVLRALRAALPGEDFLYLGDTARLPYGTKSSVSVTRYALQAGQALVERDIKLLVVACNTASAVALPDLARAWAPLPVIGVIEAGARASCEVSQSGHIGVLATESTVQGGAYVRAIQATRADAIVHQNACPLFVALAEEGWLEGELVEGIIAHALAPLLEAEAQPWPDCLVLGCTHFPVLAPAIARVVGESVALVDSAQTTAMEVSALLSREGLVNASGAGRVHFMATDGVTRFARVGSIFMGRDIREDEVELVDLGGNAVGG